MVNTPNILWNIDGDLWGELDINLLDRLQYSLVLPANLFSIEKTIDGVYRAN